MAYKDKEKQRASWKRQHDTRRKPCRRCGGQKEPGERRKFCVQCEENPPTAKCKQCGHDFIIRFPQNPNLFCSTACKNQAKRVVNPFGKVRIKHYIWGIKKKGGACRSCGAEAVHLHHAIPRSKSRALADDLRNGLPLCARCHSRWHKGYPIRREVFTEEEWECLSSAVILGWQTGAWLDKHYPSAESIAANALVVA